MQTAVIYVRVSSDQQVKGQSLEAQEDVCRGFCKARGWEVKRVFIERGESAKTDDRPEFQAAMRYLRTERADNLVVYDFSRYARDAHDHAVYRRLLAGYGIRVMSATESGAIKDDPVGRFIETVLSAKNQLDNEWRAATCRGGMAKAASKGAWCHPAPYGYVSARSPEGLPILAVDPDTGPLVVEAFLGIATRRRNIPQTQAWLGEMTGRTWPPEAVHRMLRTEVYAGVIRGRLTDHQPVMAAFPALLPEGLFERARLVVGSGDRVHRRSEIEDFPLRGILVCPEGHHITASYSSGRSARYAYYHCARCKFRVRTNCVEAALQALLPRASMLAAPLLGIYKRALADVAQELRAEADAEAGAVVSRLEVAERKLARLLDLYLSGGLAEPIYRAKSHELQIEIADLKCRKHHQGVRFEEDEGTIILAMSIMGDLVKLYAAATSQDRFRLLRAVFGELECRPDGTLEMSNRRKSAIVSALSGSAIADSRLVVLNGDWSNRISLLREALAGIRDLVAA